MGRLEERHRRRLASRLREIDGSARLGEAAGAGAPTPVVTGNLKFDATATQNAEPLGRELKVRFGETRPSSKRSIGPMNQTRNPEMNGPSSWLCLTPIRWGGRPSANNPQ